MAQKWFLSVGVGCAIVSKSNGVADLPVRNVFQNMLNIFEDHFKELKDVYLVKLNPSLLGDLYRFAS